MNDHRPVTLVSGGSRGIGRAIVTRLLSDGHAVALTYHTGAAESGRLIEEAGGRARAYPFDLADRSRPRTLVEEVERDLGPIDGLVNNAGIEHSELTAMMTDDSWDRVLDVNLGGTFRLTRETLRVMVGRRRGSIVNIASLSATMGVAGHAAYAASKAGIVGFTRCVAREMGRRKIRVNAVLPGYVATDMTADLPADAVASLRSLECLPAGVGADDVAAMVAFLLSDDAAAVSGQAIPVDAGASA